MSWRACIRLDPLARAQLRRAFAIERGDLSGLEEAGWEAPEVFVSKGRDGTTDIWGVIFRPTNFDPDHVYPVIEYIYAGPHDSFVPKSFQAYNGMREIAELVGITERATQRIIAELVEGGYLVKERDGRRNRYTVNGDASLRHRVEGDHTLGELLAAVAQSRRDRPADS